MGLARVITTVLKSFTGMFRVVELYEVKEIDAENIRQLNVLSKSTDVLIIPSKRENILVELKGQVSTRFADDFQLEANHDREAASIRLERKRQSSIIIGFVIDRSKLTINVPEKWYETIDIQTSSGSIEAKGLIADVFNVHATSGSVKINKIQTNKECSIEASSGSVRASDLQSQQEVTIHTSSGSIRANDIQSNKIRMKAGSGSLEARNLSAKETALKTSSGSIRSYDIQGNLSAETSSGSVKAVNKNLIGEWNIRTSSGSVSVQLDELDPLHVIFKGKSGSGKIVSENVEYQEKSEHSLIGRIGDGENKLTVRTSSGSFRLS